MPLPGDVSRRAGRGTTPGQSRLPPRGGKLQRGRGRGRGLSAPQRRPQNAGPDPRKSPGKRAVAQGSEGQPGGVALAVKEGDEDEKDDSSSESDAELAGDADQDSGWKRGERWPRCPWRSFSVCGRPSAPRSSSAGVQGHVQEERGARPRGATRTGPSPIPPHHCPTSSQHLHNTSPRLSHRDPAQSCLPHQCLTRVSTSPHPARHIHLATSTSPHPSRHIHLAASTSPHPPRRIHLAASTSPHPPRRIHLAASTSPHPPRRIHLAASTSPHPPRRIHLAASTSPHPPRRIHLATSTSLCLIKLCSASHRPVEMSSKRPVGRLRQVISMKKEVVRDPRFDDLSGTFSETIFQSTYSFLDSIRQREKKELEKGLKKVKSSDRKQEMEYLLQRMENQERAKQKQEKRQEAELKAKREARELMLQGHSPFYTKKSELRKQELAEKYQALKKSGKVDKFLSQKRKRNAQRDRRKLPPPKRERSCPGGQE
ncbi:ribosomal RNA processing protein 36 homolog isoform X1 [Lampetra planeri]